MFFVDMNGEGEGVSFFYDKLRSRNVVVTPEEKVRQKFMEYLINEKGYPSGVMRIERRIIEKTKRAYRPDIVIYNSSGKPFLIVECKSSKVSVNEDTAWQVMNYNKYIYARYIVITNIKKTFCWEFDKETNGYVPSSIPGFE